MVQLFKCIFKSLTVGFRFIKVFKYFAELKIDKKNLEDDIIFEIWPFDMTSKTDAHKIWSFVMAMSFNVFTVRGSDTGYTFLNNKRRNCTKIKIQYSK